MINMDLIKKITFLQIMFQNIILKSAQNNFKQLYENKHYKHHNL